MKTKWLPVAVAVVCAFRVSCRFAEAAGSIITWLVSARHGNGRQRLHARCRGQLPEEQGRPSGNELIPMPRVGFGKELKSDETKSVYIQTMFNMYDGDTNSNMGILTLAGKT